VQDASVPAHTRNEWHNLWFHYEPWLEKVRTEEVETFGGFISNPISFHPSVLERPRNDLAPVPIAGIFDTDQYAGDNPDVTAGNIVGLAEYANANFFGEATVFEPKFPYATRDYPYPSEKTSVEKKNRKIPDPRNTSKTVMRQYYVKKADGERGDPEKGYRVATVGFLKDYIIKYFPLINLLAKPALDGGVYHDYAELLLPRAVGYSAGLLKYFFRGRLEMKRIGLGNNGETILAITNLSEEPMVKGSFELYYDNDRDVRTPLRLSEKQVENLPPYDGTNRTVFVTRFAPPTNFHPDKKSQYILVYRGQLGREEGAVIGYQKTFVDYAGLMAVYQKHLRRLFFMAKDPNGEEINGYIDLRDIIKPNEDTTDWEDYRWWEWYRSDYNPLAVGVLEYNALKGVLIFRNVNWYNDVDGPSYGDFFFALKFEITGMSNPSEYFDFNLGGEIGHEPWQGVSSPTDYSYYGERISYGNGPYGLGLKRFYRYNFKHELKKIGPSWTAYTAGRGNLSVWEDGNLENPSLSDLKWSFNFVLGETSENPYRGWVQYHDVYNVSWNTSPAIVLSRFLMGYDTLHHPSGFDYREPYCSRITGMATPMKDDFTEPSGVWTEWEKHGFYWHYEPVGIDQPMEYAYMATPVSYVGLPGGGLQKRTMGAFHQPDSLDVIGDHYRMDDNYYFDGENEIPSFLMDPDTYPFGKSEKELLLGYLAIEPSGVPVMSVSSYNSWIGAANPGKPIDFYPRSWHYFKITGKLQKLDGTVETIDGIDASRRNGLWHQQWAQGMFYAPDGVWADHRYLCDYGLMAK